MVPLLFEGAGLQRSTVVPFRAITAHKIAPIKSLPKFSFSINGPTSKSRTLLQRVAGRVIQQALKMFGAGWGPQE